jgi:hypothetical protein
MSQTTAAERMSAKADQWRERIAEQEHLGISVRQFCKEQGHAEHCFYSWRKRFREQEQPMRFALVETRREGQQQAAREAALELVLITGERLHIRSGVDATTLRTVMEALRPGSICRPVYVCICA